MKSRVADSVPEGLGVIPGRGKFAVRYGVNVKLVASAYIAGLAQRLR